jgi:protein arginine kinase activator
MQQCDNCHEREAAIHLTQIVDNSVTTLHLCAQCAADKGVQTSASVAKFPLSDFVASVGKGAAAALPPGESVEPCGFCSATLQDFRETGRLGCPHCYTTFETHLRDLLRRLHGSSHHVGEVYLAPGADASDERLHQVAQFKEQLRLAIESENFELAAKLRDSIRGLE